MLAYILEIVKVIFNRKLTAVLLAAAVVVASMTCPSPLPAPPVCVQRTGRLARQAGFPLPSGERVENRDSPLAGQMNQLQVSASQVKLVNQLQVSASQVKLVNQLQVSASQVKLVQMLAPGSRFEEPDSRGDAAVAGIETLHVEFPKILTERGYRLIQGYHRGGSASSTYLAEDRQGRRVVIKYSDWEGISGNGTPWLVRQAERLREIERSFPREARALYPRVLDFYHQGEVAYYAMEYFAGATDITKYYFYDPFVTQEQIRSSVESFLTLMADTHYKHRLEAYPDELRTNMVARLRYRIGLLQKHEGEIYDRLVRGHPFRVGSLSYPDSSYFFERLMGSRYVAINGRVYPNLPILMDILEREGEKLQQMLGPTHYTPFSHGDISLRNVLALPDKSIRIIDVRGQDIHQTSPSKTSVEYDLAKIAYGFFLELVRNGYYQLNAAQGGPVFEFNYKFFNYPGNVRYQAMRKQFYQLLADNAALQGILSTPGSNWLAHVRLGESVHYASDAINRFLQDPTGEHALLYYLAATEGLYAFLKDQKLLPSDLMKEEGNSVVGVNPGDITFNSAADGGAAGLSVAEEGASTPKAADRLERSKDARGSLLAPGSRFEDERLIEEMPDRLLVITHREALDQLSPREREVLIGLFLDGKRAIQLAREAHISQSAISHCKDRALLKLRRILTGQHLDRLDRRHIESYAVPQLFDSQKVVIAGSARDPEFLGTLHLALFIPGDRILLDTSLRNWPMKKLVPVVVYEAMRALSSIIYREDWNRYDHIRTLIVNRILHNDDAMRAHAKAAAMIEELPYVPYPMDILAFYFTFHLLGISIPEGAEPFFKAMGNIVDENRRTYFTEEFFDLNKLKERITSAISQESTAVPERILVERNQAFLDQLTPKKRMVLCEIFLEGKREIRIARENGVSRAAVTVCRKRALQRLKGILAAAELRRAP